MQAPTQGATLLRAFAAFTAFIACVSTPINAQSAGKIVFSSDRDGNAEIYIMNSDGSNQTRLTRHSAADFSPVVSPDGSRVVFVSTRAGNNKRELYMMNADGSGVVRLTNNGDAGPGDDDIPPFQVGPEAPAFHPDGSRVIFSQNGELFTLELTGTASPVPVPISGANDIALKEEPVFSPEGNRIAFAGWTEVEIEPDSGIFILNSDIFVVDANGAALKRLTTDPGWDTSPSFSPDGRRIVFARGDDPSGGIYNISSTGGTATPVIQDGSQVFSSPVFSPNGQQIAFGAMGQDAQSDIFVINANGGAAHPLTINTADDGGPSWAVGTVGPTMRFTLANPYIIEGNNGNTSVSVDIELSSPASSLVTVNVRTVGGDATAGEDFVATSVPLSFAPAEVSRRVTLQIIGDQTYEPTERFSILLEDAEGASVSEPQLDLFVVNDDPIPDLHGRLAFVSFVDNNADIWLANPDRSATYNLTDTPQFDEGSPAWSPDGRMIAYASRDRSAGASDLMLINANGSSRRNLTTTPRVQEHSPSWSPDGGRVVFEASSEEEPGFQLWVVTEGADPRQITADPLAWPMPHRSPVWAPDGRIYFVTVEGSTWKLESFDPGLANRRTLHSVDGHLLEMIGTPAVSADGSRIAFVQAISTETEEHWDVFVINADGTGLLNLTQHPAEDRDPVFTPDGTKLMFSSNRDQTFDLYTVSVPQTAEVRAMAPLPAERWIGLAGDEREADWDKHLQQEEQRFFGMGFLDSGEQSEALDISNDGTVVVGTAENVDFDQRAVRWTREGGLIELGLLPGGIHSEGDGISADGSVTVGGASNEDGHQRAFRWAALDGLEDLGAITEPGPGAAFATGVSADGAVVVGWSADEQGQEHPFRWTRGGGMQNLGTFGGRRGFANDANVDGSIVVGGARDANEILRAFRWTSAEGLQQITSSAGSSEAVSITPDGSVIVGNDDAGAFRWTAGSGAITLATPPGFAFSSATDVSADGSVMVGRLETEEFEEVAALWTAATGWIDLNKAFASSIPDGWRLEAAATISGDGKWVAGVGENADGLTEGFILAINLRDAEPWFASAQIMRPGTFVLRANVIVGQSYILERSTDLLQWTRLSTIQATQPLVEIPVTFSPESREFFRLVKP